MMSDPSDYKVELDAYTGPLDLLLYLIRRDEVDIWNIPIARITEQYLRCLNMMTELNINVAGEFIVMAATLMEIKSRMMAPNPEPMPDEEEEDPRMELVRQLMEYKRFKEAALALNERAEARAERFARPGQRPESEGDGPAAGGAGADLWALLDAFSKILQQTGARSPHTLVIDRIPQERIQAELEERLRRLGRVSFLRLFEGAVTRAQLVATFIALLELVKRQAIRVEQGQPFGEIWLTYVPEEERQPVLEPAAVEAAPAAPPGEENVPPKADAPESDEGYDEEWPSEETDIALPNVLELDDPDLPSHAATETSQNEEESAKGSGVEEGGPDRPDGAEGDSQDAGKRDAPAN